MVNPARAGMILYARVRFKYPTGKPRASGDDPAFRAVADGDPA